MKAEEARVLMRLTTAELAECKKRAVNMAGDEVRQIIKQIYAQAQNGNDTYLYIVGGLEGLSGRQRMLEAIRCKALQRILVAYFKNLHYKTKATTEACGSTSNVFYSMELSW